MPIDNDAPRLKIYAVALSYINRDASPKDYAPDEYGCAESVSDIVHEAFPDFPAPIVSTVELKKLLDKHPKFERTLEPEKGVIIVSPTEGGNGEISNGHTGIFGESHWIMSNDSGTGMFKKNYTYDEWIRRYKIKGGFRIYLYRRTRM